MEQMAINSVWSREPSEKILMFQEATEMVRSPADAAAGEPNETIHMKRKLSFPIRACLGR